MILSYEHMKHRRLLEDWLCARGMPVPPADFFPPTGFVVDELAVGFLHKTDSKICYVDQVATKPGLDGSTRERLLQELIAALEAEAYRSGYKLAVACCGSENMVSRFMNRAFVPERGTFTLVHKTFSPS